MAEITLELLVRDFRADADRARRGPGPLLAQIGQLVASDLKQGLTEGHEPGGQPFAPLKFPRLRGGSKPLLDTGILRASIGSVMRYTGDAVEVGTNLETASLHQHGGTITPKRGKFLAIPKTLEALRAGSARAFPRKLFALIGSRGGVLAERKGRGKDAPLTVHYALARSVTVPARPFIGIGERAAKAVIELVRDFFSGERPPGG